MNWSASLKFYPVSVLYTSFLSQIFRVHFILCPNPTMRDFDVLWFVLILLIYLNFPILFTYNRERNRPRPPSSVIHLIRYTPKPATYNEPVGGWMYILAPCKSAGCLLLQHGNWYLMRPGAVCLQQCRLAAILAGSVSLAQAGERSFINSLSRSNGLANWSQTGESYGENNES